MRGIGARFSEADKRRILEEAAWLGMNAAEVARRYGVAPRLLRRWKQELAAAAPRSSRSRLPTRFHLSKKGTYHDGTASSEREGAYGVARSAG
jgi:transposase-like protein